MKSHDRKGLLSSTFSDKCKKGSRSWNILKGQLQKFIGWTRPLFPLTPFTSGLLFSNFMGKILSMARAMSMNFCIVNTPSIEYSNIANFNKWKLLIKGKKMLDATECTSTGNDNFATKVISMENVEKKNVEEVRRKNQTYFFSKLLGD